MNLNKKLKRTLASIAIERHVKLQREHQAQLAEQRERERLEEIARIERELREFDLHGRGWFRDWLGSISDIALDKMSRGVWPDFPLPFMFECFRLVMAEDATKVLAQRRSE